MRRRVLVTPVVAVSLTLLGSTFSPAQAGLADPEVIGGLISPLSMAVDTDGTIYVAQNFAGMLTKKAPGVDPVTIFSTTDGSEVGAVSVAAGVVTFSTTTGGERKHTGRLWRKDGDAAATPLLNTTAYEKSHNPDGGTTYGFVGISKACRALKPKLLSKYTGHLDSHPYATFMGAGVTYLADAGGNDVLAIADDGTASTVAALPATKVRITKKKQRAFGLPRCVRGGSFKAEAVPTDVELGPDGNLYVTSLPGGPEDPAFGANGRIYKIDPATGDVTMLAGGLVTPTGLAIAPNGTAYIAMLFAGVVLKVPFGGTPAPFQQIDFPGDVEYANGQVFITRTDLTNDGTQPPNGAVLQYAP